MREIEVIKTQLEICGFKARHLRLADLKEWAGYIALLTEDFELDVSGSANVPVIRGRDAAVKYVQASVEGATTVHQAHPPEFDLRADEVHVIWAMHARVVRGPEQPSYSLYGHHHDRWLRHNGEWKLAALRQTTLHLDVYPPTRR
jgi:hypothetical protein